MVQTYPLEKLGEALVNDCFDDFAIDISQPDAHQCASYEQDRQEVNVAGLATLHRWKDYLCQSAQTLPEDLVHISSTFLAC